jgi:exodeoxyribonuclease V alpha subunit
VSAVERRRLTPNGSVRERLGLPESSATPFSRALVDAARANNLGEWTVYLAWELARLMEGGTSRDREALEALVVASFASLQEGTTRLHLPTLPARFRQLGAGEELAAVARSLVEAGANGLASALIGGPSEFKPLVREGEYLYHQRVHDQEVEIAKRLKARIAGKGERSDYREILDALDSVLAHRPVIHGKPVRLSTEQQHVIRTALTRPLTLVSGGPGTGKTSVVVSMLRVLGRLGTTMDQVALAAPTGRAARRLDEALGEGLKSVPEPVAVDRGLIESVPEAKTLHRLLSRPLFAKLVIVDEASMIDLELMDRLLRALPDDAKLVLLGDSDQLPSIEAGGVFHDLLHRVEGAVQLGESHRLDPKDPSGRNILVVARHVNEVSAELLFHPDSRAADSVATRKSAADVRFEGVELLESDHEGFFDRWYQERVATAELRELAERHGDSLEDASLETVFDLLGRLHRQRVLAVTNADVDRVNRTLDRGQPIQPVIALRNDVDRGLVNGEPGLVHRGRLFFAGRNRRLRLDRQDDFTDVALAHATTVHKSQGSEHDHVALVLPEPGHPLLFRQLLYTALTRARKSVTLLGRKESVVAAIERSVERSTGIGERLQGA